MSKAVHGVSVVPQSVPELSSSKEFPVLFVIGSEFHLWHLSKFHNPSGGGYMGVSLLKISRDSVLRLPFPSPTPQLGSLWGLRRMKLMEGAPALPGAGPARSVFSQVFLVPLYVPCSQCLLSQPTWWRLGKGACGGRVEMLGNDPSSTLTSSRGESGGLPF